MNADAMGLALNAVYGALGKPSLFKGEGLELVSQCCAASPYSDLDAHNCGRCGACREMAVFITTGEER